MGIHVDEMVSEVTVEGDAPVPAAPKPVMGEEAARVREAQAQAARDRYRTAAEGYDD